MYITEKIVLLTIEKLQEKFPSQKERIERGVHQVASFWKHGDGNVKGFAKFCSEHFIGNPEDLKGMRKSLEKKLEIINGTLNRLSLELKKPVHTDIGELTSLDKHFSSLNPFSHLEEDLFNNQTAFLILLNFPHYPLQQKIAEGKDWNQDKWSFVRTGDLFKSRVPGKVTQDISDIQTKSEAYIADYNLFMHNILDKNGSKPFPKDLKLISHWGLRDEIKASYAENEGYSKQKLIEKIMEKIIYQEIPGDFINRKDYEWSPYTDKCFRKGKEILKPRENDNRYKHLLEIFKGIKKSDPFCPEFPTHIDRKFEIDRELPLEKVKDLFESLMKSETVKKVAKLISSRLKRPLEPFDLWYNGFTGNRSYSSQELDEIVKGKYRNIGAFKDDIRKILISFGFDRDQAQFIKDKIVVEPARGAGHAWGPEMCGEKAYLRTRVPAGSMDYKGFNTAMHELGHCVEQVISLYYVEHYNLHGIPNTAFTEAFAFLFQQRDLEVLNLKNSSQEESVLDTFWNSYEIMGVSMVDIEVWEWLYNNPSPNVTDLKEAVIRIAKDVWNRYYAEAFGLKDSPILAIYSHMIDCALYLPDYPLGFLIQYQIEEFMTNKNLGREMTRMCSIGRLTPEIWMDKAVGSDISAEPLINRVESFLNKEN